MSYTLLTCTQESLYEDSHNTSVEEAHNLNDIYKVWHTKSDLSCSLHVVPCTQASLHIHSLRTRAEEACIVKDVSSQFCHAVYMQYPVPRQVFSIPMVSRRGILCTRRVNRDYNLLTTKSKDRKKQIQERKQSRRQWRR